MVEVRGKFKVTTITTRDSFGPYAEVKLEAVYSQTPEDNTYAAATPSGTLTMTVTNPAALEKLALGKSFYLDFVPVEEPAS